MQAPSTAASGSADVQGDLWGARAEAWARHEVKGTPIFREALDRARVAEGTRLLDLGCAAGTLCVLARERGARVAGLDAAETLIEIARHRAPDGDFRRGDVQFLPYEDRAFEVVTAVNSLQFAADPAVAVREAARVTAPGGRVAIALWNTADRVDLFVPVRALGALVPGPPPTRSLLEPGVLEAAMSAADLGGFETHVGRLSLEFIDDEEMLDQMTSAGGTIRVVRAVGEERAREALLEAMQEFRTDDGGYRLVNAWRLVVAQVPQ